MEWELEGNEFQSMVPEYLKELFPYNVLYRGTISEEWGFTDKLTFHGKTSEVRGNLQPHFGQAVSVCLLHLHVNGRRRVQHNVQLYMSQTCGDWVHTEVLHEVGGLVVYLISVWVR